jgi:hypothetical protein
MTQPSVHELMNSPPATAPPSAVAVAGAGIRAFTPTQVAIATFLGSPLVGGITIAINARRAGRPMALPIVAGVLTTAALLAIGSRLPTHYATGVALAGVFAMRGYAMAEQRKLGATLPASWLATIGLGLAGLVLVIGAVFGVVMSQMPSRLAFGKGEVLYAHGATVQQAQAVGDELVAEGYFGDHEATVQIERDGDKLAVSFVLREGAWDEDGIGALFHSLLEDLEGKLGGQTVEIRLCNDELETERTIQ